MGRRRPADGQVGSVPGSQNARGKLESAGDDPACRRELDWLYCGTDVDVTARGCCKHVYLPADRCGSRAVPHTDLVRENIRFTNHTRDSNFARGERPAEPWYGKLDFDHHEIEVDLTVGCNLLEFGIDEGVDGQRLDRGRVTRINAYSGHGVACDLPYRHGLINDTG